MVVPGWIEPIGTLSNVRFGDPTSIGVEDRLVRYQPFFFDALYLGHTSHLMVLQGLPLHQLFVGLLREVSPVEHKVATVFGGPWIFLQGRLSAVWEPPVLRNIVLARLFEAPPEKLAGQILSRLAETLLNPA